MNFTQERSTTRVVLLKVFSHTVGNEITSLSSEMTSVGYRLTAIYRLIGNSHRTIWRPTVLGSFKAVFIRKIQVHTPSRYSVLARFFRTPCVTSCCLPSVRTKFKFRRQFRTYSFSNFVIYL